MIDESTYNQIIDYLNGKLQGKDLSDFEEKLLNNNEIQEELNFQKDLRISLQSIQNDNLNINLKHLSDLLPPPPSKQYLFIRANAWKAVFASIVLSASIFTYNYFIKTPITYNEVTTNLIDTAEVANIPCEEAENLKYKCDSLQSEIKNLQQVSQQFDNEKRRLIELDMNYKKLAIKYDNLLKENEIQVFAVDKDTTLYPLGNKNYIKSDIIKQFYIRFIPKLLSDKYYIYLYDKDNVMIDKGSSITKNNEVDFFEVHISDFEILEPGLYKIEIKTRKKEVVKSLIFSIE